jgi:hypothetical protein
MACEQISRTSPNISVTQSNFYICGYSTGQLVLTCHLSDLVADSGTYRTFNYSPALEWAALISVCRRMDLSVSVCFSIHVSSKLVYLSDVVDSRNYISASGGCTAFSLSACRSVGHCIHGSLIRQNSHSRQCTVELPSHDDDQDDDDDDDDYDSDDDA